MSGTRKHTAASTRPVLPRAILVPVADSPHLAALVREAARLATVCGASLAFLHVGGDGEAVRATLAAALPAAASALLVQDGMRVDQAVAQVAREREIDLVVAGALEREAGLSNLLLGSVARRIARGAPCPVLLLPAPRAQPTPYRRIAVAVPSGGRARELVAVATAWARADAAELHVVREFAGQGAHLAAMAEAESGDEHLRAQLAEEELALGELLRGCDLADLEVRRACLPGKDGHEAAAYAREHDCDVLIVSAPQRRPGLIGHLLGGDPVAALSDLPCALHLHRARRRAAGPGRESNA